MNKLLFEKNCDAFTLKVNYKLNTCTEVKNPEIERIEKESNITTGIRMFFMVYRINYRYKRGNFDKYGNFDFMMQDTRYLNADSDPEAIKIEPYKEQFRITLTQHITGKAESPGTTDLYEIIRTEF